VVGMGRPKGFKSVRGRNDWKARGNGNTKTQKKQELIDLEGTKGVKDIKKAKKGGSGGDRS